VIGIAFVGNDQNLLQIEDDVGDVLDHAVDGLELVVHAVDLDGGDGSALDGAEEDATQRIADGVAVAGLERLGDELGVGRRGALLDFGELAGSSNFPRRLGMAGEF